MEVLPGMPVKKVELGSAVHIQTFGTSRSLLRRAPVVTVAPEGTVEAAESCSKSALR